MSDHVHEHITTTDPHAHGITPAAERAIAADHFTDAEWANFRREDFAAGKAVVILMLSIFLTGVFIYCVVAYWVMFFSRA